MASTFYANITLTSLDGDLSVVVYTPYGLNVGGIDSIHSNSSSSSSSSSKSHGKETFLPPFYLSSRFEHGSMIGSITRKRRYVDPETGKEYTRSHLLYGTDTWRIPHNAQWPESGVGLASEFGVGDDGNRCYFRCGWRETDNVTNGVLGYEEAAYGESFLKIGVGELIKGTCPECDSTDIYKFNSPYQFARDPEWKLTYLSQNSNQEVNALQLQHQATLQEFGYHLTKDIALQDNVLSIKSTLQNLGRDAFSTVWYSHHFFTCDGHAVGPEYAVDLNLCGLNLQPVYTEPGTWSWSTPLDQYGQVTPYEQSVHVQMQRAIEPGTRIKAEFQDDGTTAGGFTLTACATTLEATLESPQFDPMLAPQSDRSNVITMYDYNLYLERGTFSPEPQWLIKDLQPGQSVEWTLKLVIRDSDDESMFVGHQRGAAMNTDTEPVPRESTWWRTMRDMSLGSLWRDNQSGYASLGDDKHAQYLHTSSTSLLLGFLLAATLLVLQERRRQFRRRNHYQIIP